MLFDGLLAFGLQSFSFIFSPMQEIVPQFRNLRVFLDNIYDYHSVGIGYTNQTV